MNSLIPYLNTLSDSRKAKGIRHQQTPTLIIMIMSMMCGYTSFHAMARFAKHHKTLLANQIPLPRGKAPCASTFLRLSHRLDVQELCKAFNQWMLNHYKPELIAIDGKSINSTVSHCHDSEQSFASLVSFFGHQSHLVLRVGTLENSTQSEIHQVQALLSLFEVEKAIFTLDALHTQKNTRVDSRE
jgi:hypothetical protein